MLAIQHNGAQQDLEFKASLSYKGRASLKIEKEEGCSSL